MKMPFFKKKYKKRWTLRYKKTIQRVVVQHRTQQAEEFVNRIDYVDLTAFGINVPESTNMIDGMK
jgi:hypothetical protein